MGVEGAVTSLVSPSLLSVPLKEQGASMKTFQFLKWEMPMSAQCQHVCLFSVPEGGALVFMEGARWSPGKCVFKESVS